MFFCSYKCTSTSLVCSSGFKNIFGLIFYPMMALAWWIEFLWLLFVQPNLSSKRSERKREISGNQQRKSVPRFIRRIFFSKNKVPIYYYAAQLNIFTSYRLTVWHAFVHSRKILNDDNMDSLGVMVKSSWYTHLIFPIPYDYVAKRLPISPDTLLLGVHSSFCLT